MATRSDNELIRWNPTVSDILPLSDGQLSPALSDSIRHSALKRCCID